MPERQSAWNKELIQRCSQAPMAATAQMAKMALTGWMEQTVQLAHRVHRAALGPRETREPQGLMARRGVTEPTVGMAGMEPTVRAQAQY